MRGRRIYTSYRKELEAAIVHVLRAKTGCWIQRQDLFAAVKKRIGYEPRTDVFSAALCELRRTKTISCHNEDQSYSIRDTETIDMFENWEEKHV